MDQASDISQPDRNWRPTLALVFTGAAIGIGLVVASGLSALALGWLPTVSTYFGLQSPEAISATQHSVAEDCTHLDPLGPDSWPNATASLRIGQVGEHSYVGIDIRNARPHTYFTVWLGLVSADPLGGTDGRNPLTGGESTPLAPSGDLPYLLQSTGAGKGNDTQPSGFRTDGLGGADFRTTLDFRILDGTYPFERFPGWDADDERLPLRDPANHNVAIAGARSPYTLQIISHCTDGIGHGLVRGPHQVWFEWKPAP